MQSVGRRAIPLLGVMGTALVHVLLLAPLLFLGEFARPPQRPERIGANANSGSPDGRANERMILIDLSSQVQAELQPAQEARLVAMVKPLSLLKILGPDSLPLKPLTSDPQGQATQSSEADLIARTQMAGLYQGQIRARIERHWLRPRTALAEPQFHCRVKIQQDARGAVSAVTMQDCEGTQEWLDSMIRAVKSASPLPAPPDPAVFAEAFEMSFHAFTFVEGGSEEGYEPVRPQILAANRAGGLAAQSANLDGRADLTTMPAIGDVSLNIVGDRIEWRRADERRNSSATEH